MHKHSQCSRQKYFFLSRKLSSRVFLFPRWRSFSYFFVEDTKFYRTTRFQSLKANFQRLRCEESGENATLQRPPTRRRIIGTSGWRARTPRVRKGSGWFSMPRPNSPALPYENLLFSPVTLDRLPSNLYLHIFLFSFEQFSFDLFFKKLFKSFFFSNKVSVRRFFERCYERKRHVRFISLLVTCVPVPSNETFSTEFSKQRQPINQRKTKDRYRCH